MKDTQLATTQNAEPSIGGMLQSFIDRGITAENVAAFAQLVELKERVDARTSEKDFAAAFVDLQSAIPTIQAVKPVPNKDGTIRYHFAPYEEIMSKVSPLLSKHGFTVSFNSRFAEGRITVICTLMHKSGHSRANEFAVRIGNGPPGSSDTQADGAAKTYAKRGALCDALNIVVEHDTDGDDHRGLGACITQEQADDLRRRVKATKANEKNFLEFAQAKTYEEIRETMLETLMDTLRKREARGAAQQPPEERDADGNFKF